MSGRDPKDKGGLVKVVGVECPKHGPKVGLFQRGQLVPFPFVMEQAKLEASDLHCFECNAVGIKRKCVVIMEPIDAYAQI